MPPRPHRRRPSQARSRATVEALVEAAAQVFEAHGYASGTTNRIADRAGVSVGSLYQYFPDKDALLLAVARRHVEDAIGRLAPLLAALDDDPEPAEALRELLAVAVDVHRDRPRLHRILFEEAPLDPALRADVLAFERAAATLVAAWLARRPRPPAAPMVTARLLVEAVESWTHRFVIHPDPAADEEAFLTAATRLLAADL